MSLIIDDESNELTTNELLIAILNELQVLNMHMTEVTDTGFTAEDVDDGYNL